nr:chlororespiratory reduction 6 domain-containing protein [Aliivibrio fischeri]
MDEAKDNSYVFDRKDIEYLNFSGIDDLIERLTRTKELLLNNRNKLSLWFAGYDDDPRELYEIPEIRRWFRVSVERGIPWFYFLSNLEESMTLKIFLYSYCNIEKKKPITNDTYKNINDWINSNFHNLNKFIDENNVPEVVNETISKNISVFMIAIKNG